eukprot:jgi/Chrzof1/10743/Cz05g10230.t1
MGCSIRGQPCSKIWTMLSAVGLQTGADDRGKIKVRPECVVVVQCGSVWWWWAMMSTVYVQPRYVHKLCSQPTFVPVHACRSLCWVCWSMVACSIRASPLQHEHDVWQHPSFSLQKSFDGQQHERFHHALGALMA